MEQYSDRQTKLWKILANYESLPDHFHDLKQSLTQEFSYLKKATSLNVENLAKHISDQETFNSTLCSQINIIHTRLSQLTLHLGQTSMSQNNSNDNDYVELTCPDFDPALDKPTEEAASHASQNQEQSDNTGGFIQQNSTGLEFQPHPIAADISDSSESFQDIPLLWKTLPQKNIQMTTGAQNTTAGQKP